MAGFTSLRFAFKASWFYTILCLFLIPSYALAAGSHSIFLEDIDLLAFAVSLTILVTVTVLFEQCVHNVKHAAATWANRDIIIPVLEKVNAELTVLGFISIIVLLLAQAFAGSLTFAKFLPELEVAHVWLFFVGMMYVVEALIFTAVAYRANKVIMRREKLPNKELLDGLLHEYETTGKLSSRMPTWSLMCGCEPEKYRSMRHKVWRIFFKQFHRHEISLSLGEKNAHKFEFAAYLAVFWKHLVISLQEIPITSWAAFLVVFWFMTASRFINGMEGDTSFIFTAISLNVVCLVAFSLLLLEQKAAIHWVTQYISRKITNDNDSSLEDAIIHIYKFSEDKQTFDHDGELWTKAVKPRRQGSKSKQTSVNMPAKNMVKLQSFGIAAQMAIDSDLTKESTNDDSRESTNDDSSAIHLSDTKNDVRMSEKPTSSNKITIELQSIPSMEHTVDHGYESTQSCTSEESSFERKWKALAVHSRIMDITRRDLKKHICIPIHTKRVIFSMLVFIHAFLYGFFVFMNIREMNNDTLYYGMLPIGVNQTLANSTDHVTHSNSHRRMLLTADIPLQKYIWQSLLPKAVSSRSLAAASSTGSFPSYDTPGWFTCSQFADAGAPHNPHPYLNYTGITYVYVAAHYETEEETARLYATRVCTVHDETTVKILVYFCTFVPLIYTSVILIPNFLELYAYQKALIGTDANAYDSRGVPHKNSSKLLKHVGGYSKSVGNLAHIHKSQYQHQHQDQHALCSGRCILDALIGKDDTTFRILIKDVCNNIVEEARALDHARSKIRDALMRPFNDQSRKRHRKTFTCAGLKYHYLHTANNTTRHYRNERTSFGSMIFSAQECVTESSKQDEESDAIESELEMTFDEKLIFRGKKLYKFISEADHYPFTADGKVEKSDLIHGINALISYRRPGDRPLTHSTEFYLMHGIDRTGDGVISEHEFLTFLMKVDLDDDSEDESESNNENEDIGEGIDEDTDGDRDKAYGVKHNRNDNSLDHQKLKEKRIRRETLALLRHNDKRELRNHIFKERREIENLVEKMKEIASMCLDKSEKLKRAGLATKEEIDQEKLLLEGLIKTESFLEMIRR